MVSLYVKRLPIGCERVIERCHLQESKVRRDDDDRRPVCVVNCTYLALGLQSSRFSLELGPVRTKASKTARRIFLYARRGSERQDFHESVIVRLMRSIVATPTLKCRAMARMDWPSLSMV